MKRRFARDVLGIHVRFHELSAIALTCKHFPGMEDVAAELKNVCAKTGEVMGVRDAAGRALLRRDQLGLFEVACRLNGKYVDTADGRVWKRQFVALTVKIFASLKVAKKSVSKPRKGAQNVAARVLGESSLCKSSIFSNSRKSAGCAGSSRLKILQKALDIADKASVFSAPLASGNPRLHILSRAPRVSVSVRLHHPPA
jgi:hypothetical protein